EPRDTLGRIARRGAGKALRSEAGAIDDGIEQDRLRIAAAEKNLPSAGRRTEALDRGVKRDDPAVVLEVSAQRQHEAMTIDDAGFQRAHRRDNGELRLQPLGGGAV